MCTDVSLRTPITEDTVLDTCTRIDDLHCPLEVLEATFSENPVLTRDPWIIARRVAGVFLGLSGRCFVEADLVVGGSFGELLVWFGQRGAISKTRQFSLLIFFRTSVRTAVGGYAYAVRSVHGIDKASVSHAWTFG